LLNRVEATTDAEVKGKHQPQHTSTGQGPLNKEKDIRERKGARLKKNFKCCGSVSNDWIPLMNLVGELVLLTKSRDRAAGIVIIESDAVGRGLLSSLDHLTGQLHGRDQGITGWSPWNRLFNRFQE